MSYVSESLISLTKNERMSDSLKKIWLKKSKILFYNVLFKVFKKKFKKMSESLIPSFLVSNVSKSFILLKSNERCERIAHFAHQKWANERFAQKILAKKI